jgi:flagellin
VSFASADGSAIAKAAAINAASGLTGVTAKVTATEKVAPMAATAFTGTIDGDVKINGVDIGPIQASSVTPATGILATQRLADAVARGTQVAAAINAKTSQTGVIATAATDTGVVTLKAMDGRNVTVATTQRGAQETGLGTLVPTVKINTLAATATTDLGANAIKIGVTGGVSVDIGAVVGGSNADTLRNNLVTAINAKINQTGVFAEVVNTNKIKLSRADGLAIVVETTTAGAAGSGFDNAAGTPALEGATTTTAPTTTPAAAITTTAAITLSTNGDKGIVVGGTTGSTFTGQKVGFNASVLSSSGGVDLSTAAGSIAALTVLDKAINTVTDSRASMGAYQNRLTASISNLEVTSMNLQASRSRILDTDYAKETTKLAKSQIIQQAATAMLAQANQSSQSVLSLLK